MHYDAPRFFALYPTTAVHGRTLQRLLGLGSASLQREVDRLLALDALERVEVGRLVCFRPVLEAKLWGAVMLLLSDTRDPVGLVRDARAMFPASKRPSSSDRSRGGTPGRTVTSMCSWWRRQRSTGEHSIDNWRRSDSSSTAK